MKIVFLDAKSIGDDIDLSGFDQLGEVVKYGFSTPEEAGERTKDADVVIINKVQINEQTIGRADRLKLVCVTATGTNNLDKEYLAKRQIEWRNVAGYSTETVAQHTFALLFYLLEKLNYYDQYVKSEKYIGDTIFTHFSNVFHDLNGMTWGIVGLGNIGRRVADIAKMFGCHDVNRFFSFGQGFYHDLGIIAIGQIFRRINTFAQRIDDECTVTDTFRSRQLDRRLYHRRGNKFIEHHSKYILCYEVQK